MTVAAVLPSLTWSFSPSRANRRAKKDVDGGPPFYGVADAAQDHYLFLCLQQAAESGATVETAEQSWADLLQPVGA